jgi:hypothetical protein
MVFSSWMKIVLKWQMRLYFLLLDFTLLQRPSVRVLFFLLLMSQWRANKVAVSNGATTLQKFRYSSCSNQHRKFCSKLDVMWQSRTTLRAGADFLNLMVRIKQMLLEAASVDLRAATSVELHPYYRCLPLTRLTKVWLANSTTGPRLYLCFAGSIG